MLHDEECIFCRIVARRAPAHIIYEDAENVAFLSVGPNTLGFTVVIPKKHYPSYIIEAPVGVQESLMRACAETARLLDEKLRCGRTGIMFEGFGVNHLHAKLSPMHGTPKSDDWYPITSPKEMQSLVFDRYPGYLSSHGGPMADNKDLTALAERIRT